MSKYDFEHFDWLNTGEYKPSDLLMKSDFPQLKEEEAKEKVHVDFEQLIDESNYYDRFNTSPEEEILAEEDFIQPVVEEVVIPPAPIEVKEVKDEEIDEPEITDEENPEEGK